MPITLTVSVMRASEFYLTRRIRQLVLFIPDNKTEDDYKQWNAAIGKRSSQGVHMRIGISYSDRPGPPHVVAEGIVGVPRQPEDDYERNMVACKLAELVECPEIAIFQFTGQIWWRLVRGGPFDVKLLKTETLRELEESEVSNRISIEMPGPFSAPVFQVNFPESDLWEQKYRANRYLRFANRSELSQRYQDLLTNITVLNDAGHVDLTTEKHWHELFRHVVVEMFLRGEPPVPRNFDPTVERAVLFPDKKLSGKAVVALRTVNEDGPVLVKYGKSEHMKALYERGEVYMPPASTYVSSEHNRAVRDHELSLSHFVVVRNNDGYVKARDVFSNQDALKRSDHRVLSLFGAPNAERDDVGRIESVAPDAWVYCLSHLLKPRLFVDFDADACVVLSRDKLIERICDALHRASGKALSSHGFVHYIDPFGAYQDDLTPPEVIYSLGAEETGDRQEFEPFGPGSQLMRPPMVHFGKTFRFSYQSEYRFVSYPTQHAQELNVPIQLTLGPLIDIGELIIL